MHMSTNPGTRKRSGTNFEELMTKEFSIISKPEQNELLAAYKKNEQRGGGISFYDLINIIRNAGYEVNEDRKYRLNKQIAIKEIKTIDFTTLLWATVTIKKQKDEASSNPHAEDNEYLDSFVALGGNPDKTGFVSKSTLIETIRNEFELAFDIEMLVEGIQGAESEKLDYTMFCELFQQDKRANGMNRSGSVASLLSSKPLKPSDSMKSLVINEKDFERYYAREGGHEAMSP